MFTKPEALDVSLHKIYAEDGLELDSILFEPKKKTKKIVIHLHGKEGHFVQNHFVTAMGYTYPLQGYAFLTFNNRGHDYMADILKKSATGFDWVTRGAAFEQIEEAVMDINGVISYVSQLGYEEVILQGHSLGPHKISFYLANNPKYSVSKVILLSPGDVQFLLKTTVPSWEEHSIRAKNLIDAQKENELMPVKLWSNSPVSAKTFWHYTKHDSNTWIFNFMQPNFEFKHFNKITQPMLVVVPENDFARGVSAEVEIKFLKEKTVSKNFTAKIVANTVHNFGGKEVELVQQIISWLASKN